MSSVKFDPKGHLEIWKVYEDGSDEMCWSENNVITSGMGVGLASLFAASGSSNIKDYQIGYFQVGVSGDINNYDHYTFELSAPLASSVEYGVLSSPLGTRDSSAISFTDVVSLNPLKNGKVSIGKEPFAKIRHSNMHRIAKNSVRFTLVLAPRSCVNKNLNEVGLFMRNPFGFSPDSPVLVAYRPFTTIKKTSAFSLVFLWTIQF